MTDQNTSVGSTLTVQRVRSGLARRYRLERWFRRFGMMAVALGLSFVLVLFASIGSNGISAFHQGYVRLDITLDEKTLDPAGSRDPEVIGELVAHFGQDVTDSFGGINKACELGIGIAAIPERIRSAEVATISERLLVRWQAAEGVGFVRNFSAENLIGHSVSCANFDYL